MLEGQVMWTGEHRQFTHSLFFFGLDWSLFLPSCSFLTASRPSGVYVSVVSDHVLQGPPAVYSCQAPIDHLSIVEHRPVPTCRLDHDGRAETEGVGGVTLRRQGSE